MQTKLLSLGLFVGLSFTQLSQAAEIEMRSQSSYPFVCYQGSVEDNLNKEFIEGKVLKIYYGYTALSEAEFRSQADAPWFNLNGEPVAEAVIDLDYSHDGGYPGNLTLESLDLEIPEGLNLVYRIGYMKKVGGDCYSSANPVVSEYNETQVFFVSR